MWKSYIQIQTYYSYKFQLFCNIPPLIFLGCTRNNRSNTWVWLAIITGYIWENRATAPTPYGYWIFMRVELRSANTVMCCPRPIVRTMCIGARSGNGRVGRDVVHPGHPADDFWSESGERLLWEVAIAIGMVFSGEWDSAAFQESINYERYNISILYTAIIMWQ